MSQENVELIRSGFDAINRRDFDHATSLVSDDFEINSAITNQTYQGPDAVRRVFEDLLAAFGEHQMVIEETIATGDQVVVMFRLEVSGRGSGLPLSQSVAQVWSFQDGLAIRCRSYLDRREALASAGLS